MLQSPFADGRERPVMTTIFYLLTPDEPKGYFLRNKSHTMHVHHQGRVEYTLINPRPSGVGADWAPEVTKYVMGADHGKGELRQFFVGSGVWKMSQLPAQDLAAAEASARERTGCLITEVVSPGFVWEDHEWMTMDILKDLFRDSPNAKEEIARFAPYVRPDGHT